MTGPNVVHRRIELKPRLLVYPLSIPSSRPCGPLARPASRPTRHCCVAPGAASSRRRPACVLLLYSPSSLRPSGSAHASAMPPSTRHCPFHLAFALPRALTVHFPPSPSISFRLVPLPSAPFDGTLQRPHPLHKPFTVLRTKCTPFLRGSSVPRKVGSLRSRPLHPTPDGCMDHFDWSNGSRLKDAALEQVVTRMRGLEEGRRTRRLAHEQ